MWLLGLPIAYQFLQKDRNRTTPLGAWGVALPVQLSRELPGAHGHVTYLTVAQLDLPLPPALLAHWNLQLPPSAGGHLTQSYPLQELEPPAL
jgi:hypothetical protein